jgi:hypothetical protein
MENLQCNVDILRARVGGVTVPGSTIHPGARRVTIVSHLREAVSGTGSRSGVLPVNSCGPHGE